MKIDTKIETNFYQTNKHARGHTDTLPMLFGASFSLTLNPPPYEIVLHSSSPKCGLVFQVVNLLLKISLKQTR